MDTEEPSLGLKTRASVALLGRGEPLRPPPVLRPGPPAPPARPECPVRGPPRQTLTRCPRSARRSREAQVDRVPWKLAPPPPSVCAPRGWADSKGRCGAGPRMTRGLAPAAQCPGTHAAGEASQRRGRGPAAAGPSTRSEIVLCRECHTMGGWPREPAASRTGQAAEQRRSRGRGVGGQGRTRAALPALVSGVKSGPYQRLEACV